MLTADLVDAQRAFFAELSFVIATHVDEQGRPRAELVTGPPGFITAGADGRVHIAQSNDSAAPGAALWSTKPGNTIGLLGIEFARRRRNRINGTVIASDADGITVQIDQGYGNCPKYITKRDWDPELFAGDYTQHRSSDITDEVAALIARTDTFFIATSSGPSPAQRNGTGSYFPSPERKGAAVANGIGSYYPSSENKPGMISAATTAWGADISHRGGDPGFLNLNGQTLTFDDYPGNNLFNTLGNLKQYPTCGLLIMDFKTGDIVQIAGDAKLSRVDDPNDEKRGGHFHVTITITNVHHWKKGSVPLGV
jgi:hypothetical protein